MVLNSLDRRTVYGAVAGTVAALACAGCLVPLPIEEDVPDPNYPPFFTADRVVPDFSRVLNYDAQADGTTLRFELVDYGDPNPEDRLFWRWFVDYTSVQFAIRNSGPSAGLSPELRGAPIFMVLNPCVLPRRALHRVDLIVTDRAFVSNAEEAPNEPNPNQALPDGAGSFRVTWFLALDTAGCP